ncbi:MAG TPA: hypothetical protein VFE86_07540 [Ilumatobacteraceae bacterium]|nr:hypothetical protein [Ilumatobacteraceae bacterium]
MDASRSTIADQRTGGGVVANSRLTASAGMILLVALAVEGITLFDVNTMFALHAFVGLLLVPVALLKMCTTAYRFVKYYTRDQAYRRKGPPHPILRIIGPVVVISTVALLGTGVVLLAKGPRNSGTLVSLHQASFIVWVSATTIHVLGHIVETFRLTADDLRSDAADEVPGVAIRRVVLLLCVVIGLGLGVASLGWNDAWTHAFR